MRPDFFAVVTINNCDFALNLISKTITVKLVRDRIGNAHFTKSSQAQRARIAIAASEFRSLITGPRKIERCTELQARADDFRFLQVNYRRPDSDVRVRLCAKVDHVLKRGIKLRTAIRIT